MIIRFIHVLLRNVLHDCFIRNIAADVKTRMGTASIVFHPLNLLKLSPEGEGFYIPKRDNNRKNTSTAAVLQFIDTFFTNFGVSSISLAYLRHCRVNA